MENNFFKAVLTIISNKLWKQNHQNEISNHLLTLRQVKGNKSALSLGYNIHFLQSQCKNATLSLLSLRRLETENTIVFSNYKSLLLSSLYLLYWFQIQVPVSFYIVTFKQQEHEKGKVSLSRWEEWISTPAPLFFFFLIRVVKWSDQARASVQTGAPGRRGGRRQLETGMPTSTRLSPVFEARSLLSPTRRAIHQICLCRRCSLCAVHTRHTFMLKPNSLHCLECNSEHNIL